MSRLDNPCDVESRYFSSMRIFIRRRVPWVVLDASIVVLSLALAWAARSITADIDLQPAMLFSLLAIAVYCGINYLFRLYHRIWRYASAGEVVVIAGSVVASTGFLAALDLLWLRDRPVPVSVVLLAGLFILVGFVGVRYRRRLWSGLRWRWWGLLGQPHQERTRVLMVGAGEVGQLLAWRFLHQKEGQQYRLVGFVDDDPIKHGMRIHGIKVLGGRHAIPDIVARHGVDLTVIAIHNVSGADFRAILDICESTPAVIKVIPNMFDVISGVSGQLPIRDVTPEDLLGRVPVHIDFEACRNLLANKNVLVTGAAGSIGSELCRQIVTFEPRQLLMLDNNESGLFDTVESVEHVLVASLTPQPSPLTESVPLHGTLRPVHEWCRSPEGGPTLGARRTTLPVTPIIADVTNEAKMGAVFARRQPQVVFHAAAYKHVPLMEEYPDEAVRVNVLGTRITASLAARYGAERFVLVSTDKAINPRSVMGATKRIGEMMIADAATLNPQPPTPSVNGARPASRDSDARSEADNAQPSPPTESVPLHGTPTLGARRTTLNPSLSTLNPRSSILNPRRSTIFTAVRFGNVLGSRGSVVPTFERQIDRGGPVTVTHPEMTRYLMSIPEAVSLIIQAATITQGGDIFMLDMGQRVRIDDLARRLIRLRGLRPGVDIPVVYTGVRPGEKMHEELLGDEEERSSTTHPHIFRIREKHSKDRFEILRQVDELIELAENLGNGSIVAKLWDVVGDEGQRPGAERHPVGVVNEAIPDN